MALLVVGTLRRRLLAREAVSSKGKRASARNTMKAPNNQSLQSFATIGPHNAIVIMQTMQALWHKQRKRDNANNASVIMANCRHYKLSHTVSITQDGTSEHHLARTSEHHKPSGTSKHHKLEGVSLHHLAAARVSITNPGAQFFILYTFKRGLILYSLSSQHAINSLLLTITKCNQFFILYSFKVQLIVNCYYRQSAINCY
jgi:hypothetical protein